MKSQWSLKCILGFIVFASRGTLAIAASEQLSSVHEVQEYDALEEIKDEIENISNHITLMSYEKGDTVKLLNLYNERGLRYFCIGLLKNAFDDFNYVINVLINKEEIEETPLALALWGRMLCHSYNNHEEAAFQDLHLFQSYFLSEAPPCEDPLTFSANLSTSNMNSRKYRHEFQNAAMIYERSPPCCLVNTHNENLNYSDYVHPIAQFANPNEKLSKEDCKDRVKCTADIMRLLTARIPSSRLAGAVNIAISRLEELAISCCYRSHWTDCMNPVIDAYNYIRKCMDKGASIAPKIIWPGR